MQLFAKWYMYKFLIIVAELLTVQHTANKNACCTLTSVNMKRCNEDRGHRLQFFGFCFVFLKVKGYRDKILENHCLKT